LPDKQVIRGSYPRIILFFVLYDIHIYVIVKILTVF